MKKETGKMMFNMAREMLENCEKYEDLRKKKRLLHERAALELKIC
jgi:hypothetical protein